MRSGERNAGQGARGQMLVTRHGDLIVGSYRRTMVEMHFPEPTVDPYLQPDTPTDEVERLAKHVPVRRSRLGPLLAGSIVLVGMLAILLVALALIFVLFRPA